VRIERGEVQAGRERKKCRFITFHVILKEKNFETNNTLLLMREFYNYNRFRFQRFISELLRVTNMDADRTVEVGLQIKQQIGTKESVIDGYLYQDSFRIAIETKRSAETFSVNQLKRHLSAFEAGHSGFLILLSPEKARIPQSEWLKLAKLAADKDVTLVAITFEAIIDAAPSSLSPHDEEMHALITDYETFCSEEELLPTDKWTLFVPPCGQSHNMNVAHSLYFCPASWSRRKARYLGIYYEKAIRYIGEITKVVECEITGNVITGETESLMSAERKRITNTVQEALEQQGWDLSTGYQFFLCDTLLETLFKKTSSGGIMGHRYFDLREYFKGKSLPELQEVADVLKGK
jgi:hypothetical protein